MPDIIALLGPSASLCLLNYFPRLQITVPIGVREEDTTYPPSQGVKKNYDHPAT